ncbi:esterase B1-like [Scaptodrosophila lebanonensis]|uniref:carboxylesterase n=1 Tax=Drosophila lebanonensis TaxID=7225 RepID=A0A6J2TDI3_DROLE|nr:esterase B1-like [Scaptodrosophila lebanonensis]
MLLWFSPVGLESVVSLPQGDARGKIDQTVYGDRYFSFEGLPYAMPPVGNLRFQPPVPPPCWTGPRNFFTPGNKSIQKNWQTGTVEGSEDCLYLNVYTKELYGTVKMPVIVFIHGGSYNSGGAVRESFSPDYFMLKDVVLVTFNYRLGCLGFLSLKDPDLEVPGNNGIKDMILALRWVKNNIILFNGDPEKIAVCGMAAGAAAVHYLMCTPHAKDLFQRAILMAGCTLNYWASMPQKDFAFRLAKLNGYKGVDDDASVLRFLSKIPAEALVDQWLLTTEELEDGYVFAFGPVIEPYITSETLIPTRPVDMLRQSWGNCIPLILGGTSFEGLYAFPLLLSHPELVQQMKGQPQNILPYDAREGHSEEFCLQLSKHLIQKHFGKGAHNSTDEQSLLDYMDFVSYKNFWHGLHRTTLSRVYYTNCPTYLYRFDFYSRFNQQRHLLLSNQGIHAKGAAHGDELSYLFFSSTSWPLKRQSPEFINITRMIAIWTSFADSGRPKCPELNNIRVHWHPLRVNKVFQALNIGKKLEFIEIPERAKLEAWNDCYEPEQLY